jgi:hypothetical protein
MTNEMDSLKCSIKIDYYIPFDFTEERELAFGSIVDSLYKAIGCNDGIGILANYTTNTDIDIYKSTDSNISREYFKSTIKDTLESISKTEVKVKTENSEMSYSVDFYIEFSNSDNFKISKVEGIFKDFINSKKKKDDKKDDNSNLVNVEVKFNAIIDKNSVEEFEKIIEREIDTLIDLHKFPGLRAISSGTIKNKIEISKNLIIRI